MTPTPQSGARSPVPSPSRPEAELLPPALMPQGSRPRRPPPIGPAASQALGPTERRAGLMTQTLPLRSSPHTIPASPPRPQGSPGDQPSQEPTLPLPKTLRV